MSDHITDKLDEILGDEDSGLLLREVMIMAFNRMLDKEHGMVLEQFMQPVEIKMEWPLYTHKMAAHHEGRRYMSRLDFISLSCSDMPIVQVCENGVVQRFE